MYKCEILADSLSTSFNRLTTFKVTYPRIVHAEMCRHRMLSRNTASSRAIPFEKMVKDVEENPFIPIAWQKSHKGMQGGEYWYPEMLASSALSYGVHISVIDMAQEFWLQTRDSAVNKAKMLHGYDITKQLCNRLLEPFVWTTELISGTEWSNFFNLRCPRYWDGKQHHRSRKDYVRINDPDRGKTYSDQHFYSINESQADIHIQAIAEMMWDAYNDSDPKLLDVGQWHIPYGDNIDIRNVYTDILKQNIDLSISSKFYKEYQEALIKIATARCARISYTTLGQDPKIDYDADIKLHDKLIKDAHYSPFEHCAKATNNSEMYRNFRGFIQYRHLIEKQQA